MKSNYPFKILQISAVLLFFIAMNACKTESAVSPDEAANENYESSQYAVYEFEDETAAISDATLESDMSLAQDSPTDHHALNENRGRSDFMQRRREQGMHLKYLLVGLQLSDEQRTQVQDFLAQYRECIAVPLQEFRDEASPIIEAARAQRQTLIDSVNAGALTREEARDQLRALNLEKREELKALQVELGLLEAMCECKLSLFTNISGLLSEEQKAVYDAWYTKLEGVCFSTEDSSN
ncbi:MAG: hypothetical protein DWQ05_12595 [Calditrichaeota bacterium]|nr:MAG: hypothetical protein DWQ05_12595 [Calditrichota bacterium]